MTVLYIVATQEDAVAMRERGEDVHVLGGLIEPIKGLGPERLNVDFPTADVYSLTPLVASSTLDDWLERSATALWLTENALLGRMVEVPTEDGVVRLVASQGRLPPLSPSTRDDAGSADRED